MVYKNANNSKPTQYSFKPNIDTASFFAEVICLIKNIKTKPNFNFYVQ